MILKRFFRTNETADRRLYEAIVAAARHPVPYASWGVADTVDGRFDMIALHLFLVLSRLKQQSPEFAQRLVDTFFADMDRSLREMGVGDLSVAKKIRPMAEAFSGRLVAYEKALAEGKDALELALSRNVYRSEDKIEGASKLADYVLRVKDDLARQPIEVLEEGKVSFPVPA